MQSNLFSTLPLSEEVLRAVEDMEYTQMTQIQKEAIPFILEGNDIIGRSSTGTGKTAAFGIPAVEMLSEDADNRPRVLILCPTRELAVQVSDEIKKFAKYKPNISAVTVYGGQSMELQIRQLKQANIVVGTPGRIMDHMRRRTLRLDKVRTVILDEADEMLNMGFYEDIKLILSEAPEERQTVLFSATMPPAIMQITREFQKEPKLVAVDNEQKTVDTITQLAYHVPQGKKIQAMKLLLSYHKPNRSLIFCNTKKMVDELVDNLNDDGYKCIGLHGDMNQNLRNRVMADYKSGKIEILIATDVAARGIDVTDIDAVFNFDIPLETEYYIHRIGRTGRAGKAGVSYTLIANKIQLRKMEDIRRFTKAEVIFKDLPSGEVIDVKNRESFATRIKTAIDEHRFEEWNEFVESVIDENHKAKDIAAALMGMLAEKDKTIMPPMKDIVIPAENFGDPVSYLDRLRNPSGAAKMLLSINIGKKENIAPNYIVGAIVEATGIASKRIGKITIYADTCTVELLKEDAEKVLQKMQNTKIKNKTVRFAYSDKKASPASAGRKPGTRSEKSYNRRDEQKNDRNNDYGWESRKKGSESSSSGKKYVRKTK